MNWFKQRQQSVVINGNLSNRRDVCQVYHSDLSSVLFCLYLYRNDLSGVVRSFCKLFANDCKLCHKIASEAGQKELQECFNIKSVK